MALDDGLDRLGDLVGLLQFGRIDATAFDPAVIGDGDEDIHGAMQEPLLAQTKQPVPQPCAVLLEQRNEEVALAASLENGRGHALDAAPEATHPLLVLVHLDPAAHALTLDDSEPPPVHDEVADLTDSVVTHEPEVTKDDHVVGAAEGPLEVEVHLPLGLDAGGEEAILRGLLVGRLGNHASVVGK